MSTPLESDTELRQALETLAMAENLHQRVLVESVAAARVAAAQVTNEELDRWTATAAKLWDVQTELVDRHGVFTKDVMTGRSIIHARTHRSWLGNAVGISLPLSIFGASLLEHSFILPLFWATSIAADIAGCTTCLKRARISDCHTTSPRAASLLAKQATHTARESQDWAFAIAKAQQLDGVDIAIMQGDVALKRARHFGQKVGATSLLLFVGTLAAAVYRIVPRVVLPWTLMLMSLASVFGTACWFTSLSYTGAEKQPPYPTHGSSQRFKRHVHFESLLARVPNTSFNSHESVTLHTTQQMQKKRVLLKALRELEKSKRHLEDARWKVAMLEAERCL